MDSNWYWIGVGALLGYIFLFNILFVLFLDWLDREYSLDRLYIFQLLYILYLLVLISCLILIALGKGQTVISEETLREKHANRTGETVELLPAGADSSKPVLSEG